MNQHELSQLVQDVIDGNENPIKAFGIIKQQLAHCEACLEKIKSEALEEAKKHENFFEMGGMYFEKRNGGKYFDFSNVPAWNSKKEELKEIEDKCKAAYSNYEKGQQSVTQDGEIVEIPIVKYKPDVLILKK